MCARSAKSSPFSVWTKFCLSQATALAICWPGDPVVTRYRSCAAVRAGQEADCDFLLNQRRQSGNQCRLGQQSDEPDEGIEQGAVECFEGDRPIGMLSPRPGVIHLGRDLQDRTGVQRQHHAKKRFAATGSRDMRNDGEIDGRQHRLPRTVVDGLTAEQDLLVSLCDNAEPQVVDAVQGLSWCVATM